MRRLRPAVIGRTIRGVRTLHRVVGRTLPPEDASLLAGRQIVAVERWAKYQLLQLDDGSALEAHFRMAGDWAFGPTSTSHTLRHARAAIDLDDDSTVTLTDGRGFATLRRIPPGTPPPTRAPDALDAEFDAAYLARVLAGRRQAIKPTLLDQALIGGIGNIYASEALWQVRIDPRTPASRVGPRRVARLALAIGETLTAAIAHPGRYAEGEATDRLAVYDREGEPCLRCGRAILRVVQSGRSTYYCPGCQRR
ncbi:MAG: formamidopyrimidine-DNA glycosylase [Candidatus Eremiobacteraeota bacterium]|nr:formamidopyrimidine-DNA glycosylase [Candidatus Eremiobacteraeota bacterium]